LQKILLIQVEGIIHKFLLSDKTYTGYYCTNLGMKVELFKEKKLEQTYPAVVFEKYFLRYLKQLYSSNDKLKTYVCVIVYENDAYKLFNIFIQISRREVN